MCLSLLSDSYNKYREMTGYTLPPLEDTTPLLYALSCSTNGDSTPDLLYAAISDIVSSKTFKKRPIWAIYLGIYVRWEESFNSLEMGNLGQRPTKKPITNIWSALQH